MWRVARLIGHFCPSLSEPSGAQFWLLLFWVFCLFVCFGAWGVGAQPCFPVVFASLCPPWSCLLPLAVRELHPRGFTCQQRPQHKAGRKSAEEGGKINILFKKLAAGAAGIGLGTSVGVKPSVPGGRAPRLCPRAAARRERGADQPVCVCGFHASSET